MEASEAKRMQNLGAGVENAGVLEATTSIAPRDIYDTWTLFRVSYCNQPLALWKY